MIYQWGYLLNRKNFFSRPYERVTMKVNDGYLDSQDGTKIFYQNHKPENSKSSVLICHGLGEHLGHYDNVVNALTENQYSVWLFDHRGHGKSSGKRGHILSFNDYHLDLQMLVDKAFDCLDQNHKLFLLGHSMGGLIALSYAQNYINSVYDKINKKVSGIIISSPALGLTMKVPIIKKILGNIMSFIFPGFTIKTGLDETKLSHDPKITQTYLNDPLVHYQVTARWFREYMKTMEDTNLRFDEINIPTLMQIAGDDEITSASAAEKFFNKLMVKDKTLCLYKGYYHEVYNEEKKKRAVALKDLIQWLNKHI